MVPKMTVNLTPPTPRKRPVILALSIITGFTLILLFGRGPGQFYTGFRYGKSEDRDPRKSPVSWGKPKHCVDPYRQPGLFFYPNNSRTHFIPDRSQTQWVPYNENFFRLQDPPQAAWPAQRDPVFHGDSTPPREVLEKAPGNWMMRLVKYHNIVKKDYNGEEQVRHEVLQKQGRNERHVADDMSWLRNRRVLLIGDSVARHELEYFCKELGFNATNLGSPSPHYVNECHIPSLNFTLSQWHLAGMYTNTNSTWWWIPKIKIVDFETRFEKYHIPYLPRVNGLSGRSPDLILYGSVWDQRIFRELALSKNDTSLDSNKRHLTWEEATFLSARTKKFISYVRNIFGSDVPIMFQSLTSQFESRLAANAEIADIDRLNRFVAGSMGIETFEWARLIQGHEGMFWLDVLHPRRSPVSWLWSNMMLHYLFRAVGGLEVEGKVVQTPPKEFTGFEGWDECHPWNMPA